MQSTIEHLENIVSKAGDIAETKVELWKLKATSGVSEAASSIISKLAVAFVAGIALLILSFGVAYWIGSEMDNIYAGFFIVGGFYALIGLLVYAFRKSLIKRPISQLIIDKIIKK